MLYSPENLHLSEDQLTRFIGGKGKNLLTLWRDGFPVPKPLFISTECYEEFITNNDLREKIDLELHRKNLKEMRWEEIWDTALRIQSLFLQGRFPKNRGTDIESFVNANLGENHLVIRSSAPNEDSAAYSFAGLHESYLNIPSGPELLNKIKKVWASLWSDRAILYRQELGLNVKRSSMAVVIQELVAGDYSGVVFSRNPLNQSQIVLEAVHGLNQGLVDGAIEPDRWILERKTLKTLTHHSPERIHRFTKANRTGVKREQINSNLKNTPPLNNEQIRAVAELSLKLEKQLGTPQDVEWTITDRKLQILQCRPLTTTDKPAASDQRPWYLSLTRSYDNLLQLWKTIDQELLPAMDEESSKFSNVVLENLTDKELAEELKRRDEANAKWTTIYWSEFIPFAHGVRLFGELYNEVMKPDDPFEFVSLLTGQNLLSTDRNKILYECAEIVRNRPILAQLLEQGQLEEIKDEEFQEKLDLLNQRFAMLSQSGKENRATSPLIAAIILQYAKLDTIPQPLTATDLVKLENDFIDNASETIPFDPVQLLEMARASYRIRDDDNIHIGRINQELKRAVSYVHKRVLSRKNLADQRFSLEDLVTMLVDLDFSPPPVAAVTETEQKPPLNKVKARQLQGQAASRGIARGRARVIAGTTDVKEFQQGEILVIDSIDPTMTFFAPLAAGIVERRGGMLIHGAIIAREYGIPCITGVAEAANYIKTGDVVTVDGFLGIVTIQRI